MATTTEPEVKPNAQPVDTTKKTVVPKEVRQRIIRGEEAKAPDPSVEKPNPGATTSGASATTTAAATQATPTAEELAAKAEADRKAEEAKAAAKRAKKATADLPPIPTAPAAAPVTREEVRQIVADTKPVTGAAAVTTALTPDDQNDLELAQFAARQHSDKYADLPERVSKWFTTRDGFLAEKAKELGGRESPEFRDFLTGDDFRKFVREHAPTYQRGDAKKVYEEFLEERGAQRALQKIKPEIDEVRRRQQHIEQAPVIQQTVTNGLQLMMTDNSEKPDESLSEFQKNPVEFVKANEVEGGIIVRHASFFKEAMEETLRITSGLVDSAQLEKPNSTQLWIDQFINKLDREIESKFPNGAPSPDGKIIVSQGQMQRLRAANVPNLAAYRMMLPNEIIGSMAVEGRQEIKRQLDAERQKLERSGFTRVKKAQATTNAPKQATTQVVNSPMAGSSPAAGAASTSGASKQEPYWKKYITGKET